MTGTPIVNRPAELYNIIEDLGGDWGSFFSFAKRYANAYHNGWGWDFSGASNLEELQRRLRETIMVRRLKADVLQELPRKVRQIVEVEVTTSAHKKAVRAEADHEAESEKKLAELRAAVELSKAESEDAYKAAVEKLREASRVSFSEMSRLRHETALAKLGQVVDHVKMILEDGDGKVVIGAHHHDVIEGLVEGLAEFNPVSLTGENTEQERLVAVDRFQEDLGCRVFVGSIQAAGFGITLTASSHVVFAELDWVPGNVTQFEDRCHRIGQEDTVLVQHLVLDGSLDARMAHVLVDKQAVIDRALDDDMPEIEYIPKETPSTYEVKVSELEREAIELTAGQIEVAHDGLRILAGFDPDHASERNGIGFNKLDGRIGHSLAERDSLTPKQAALARKLCQRYRRQLPERVLSILQDGQNVV